MIKNILEYIKSFFRLKTEIITTNVKNENDSDLIEFKLVEQLKCPICEQGGLLSGPRGGLAINVKCDNNDCDSYFNILFIDGECRYIKGIKGTHFPKLSR